MEYRLENQHRRHNLDLEHKFVVVLQVVDMLV
jgi:hypothetical protein